MGINMMLAGQGKHEETTQNTDSASEVFEENYPEYAQQGPNVVSVPDGSPSHDDSTNGKEDSSDEASKEEAPPVQIV